MKEAVYDLTANSKVACYISHGTGIKASAKCFVLTAKTNMKPITKRALLTFVLSQVYNWSGTPKHINFNKYVKCLAMTGDKLYCGCSSYRIQVNFTQSQNIAVTKHINVR